MLPSKRGRSEPLAPVDHAWLRMEDPTNLMMVTGILIFDQPLDFVRRSHESCQGSSCS